MKMLSLVILFVLAMSSSHACSQTKTFTNIPVAPSTVVEPSNTSTFYQCVNKYTEDRLDFFANQVLEQKSTLFKNVKLYEVIDVNGKHWLINQYQWVNFVCTPQFPTNK